MAIIKERLDIILVQKGFAPSREKARAVIMAGSVFVNGQREDKAGTKIDTASIIEVKGNPLPYVSRGGLKLEKAVKSFKLSLSDKICMDVGSSTGGFTDCMLQNNAAKVYAVDVGYGQLDYRLRQDERVICMEKTNIRYVVPEDIEDIIEFASVDVSFISLRKIMLPIYNLMKEEAQCVCLIKPQFEAGREKVGKKGVVRDPATHFEVIYDIIQFACKTSFEILGIDFSPIKGPEGNIEYLLHIKKSDSASKAEDFLEKVKKVVDIAHENL